MEFKDYYKIMGVSREATQEDIKHSYRKLARKYHPDVSKEKEAERHFKELGEAYEVLKDPEKRAAYDRLGANWRAGQDFRPPPGWDAGFEFSGGFPGGETDQFSDFFESLFGGRGAHSRSTGRRGNVRSRGQDHRAKIMISLEDSYNGATRSVQLQVPELDSHGRVHTRNRTLSVKLPQGIAAGQQVRLAGQGAPGAGGGDNGDLLLEIEFMPHRLYRADNRDIYLNLPITPWEAALGGTIEAPTLGGKVDLKIPANSQTGQKLRLKSRGLPGNPAGDHYVILQIATPPADTDAARELYREMARRIPFNPRKDLGG
jgi:curved DNA-binding protein